ncbi:ATP-binding protein [Candidatus Paracaedibacter symbiosus]|uniref:sensor histidine kinase n=1 Tax=Candidatus Paracaedibacter symbiosus TaxID=244582 RepID=UPI0006916A49|nr:ATP-binding protein [Candidatus Paracaedibacter symbiosus]
MKPKNLMFKDILIYFLVAFFLCFLSVFIVSFISFKKLYQQSVDETSLAISGALKNEETRFENIIYSLAIWNQSYQNISLNLNKKWIEENIVYDIKHSHDIPLFAVINSENDQVIYSTDATFLEVGKSISSEIKKFLNLYIKQEGSEKTKSGLVKVYSSLYLLSVASVSEVNVFNHQETIKPTKLAVLIGTPFNETFLRKMATNYNLGNLKFYSLDQKDFIAGQPSYLVHEEGKNFGYISWSPRDKTQNLLLTIIPTGFIVIFLLSLIGVLVARKLARVSYNYEQMIWDLSELANNLEKEKLETSSDVEAKNRFMAMMSHQIRTPMTGLVGMISLLKETELTDAQIKYVNTMEFSAESLLKLVDSILEFSRLESEQVSLSFSNINIRQLVDEVQGLLLPIALQRKLKFEVFFSKEVPLIVRSDAIRLRQIILHLVTNALKFTKVGSVKVNVTAVPLPENRAEIGIQVIDTGVGIAEGLRQSLFEEFFKVDSGRPQSGEGIGLGLAIVQSLINLLQGKLGVESKLGQGSTFWVQFQVDVVEAYDSGNHQEEYSSEN